MTTAGYIRVSTKEQDPDRQQEELDNLWEIDRWYADVGSGMNTQRDEFHQMMDELDEIDRVVVWESSRLTRSLEDMISILKEFEKKNVSFETLDTLPDFNPEDPISRAMVQIIASVQEMEREQIVERIQSGVDRAMENGKHVGNVPTGYTVDDDGFLIPDEPMYTKVNNYIREVNNGRAKATTAKFFGIPKNSAQSILRNSSDYWDEEYTGDKTWRQRRTAVENGVKDLIPLGDQ